MPAFAGHTDSPIMNPGPNLMPQHVHTGDGDAEHLQLAMDPRCTPEGVGDRHLFDQSANLHGGCGPPSTTTVRFGQACPESTEPFTMPAGDRVRLEIEQRTAPAGPPSSEGYPEQPIPGGEDRSLMLALVRR